MRTYLQMRIGLHARFNACDEMCERVALERQLPGDERMALIQRSQRVIHLGRDILYAWDTTRNDAPTLDNAVLLESATHLADALEKYAADLATASSLPPSIENLSPSQDILPTLPKQERCIIQQITCLPDWTHPTLIPASEQEQGTSQ